MASLANPPKQIRFVTNRGQPPTKRRRINAACLTCRRRKTRCAGEHPTCSTCAKNGHKCLGYSDGGERRRPGTAEGPGQGLKSDDEQLGADDDDPADGDHEERRARPGGPPQHPQRPAAAAAAAAAAAPLGPRMGSPRRASHSPQGRQGPGRAAYHSADASPSADDGLTPRSSSGGGGGDGSSGSNRLTAVPHHAQTHRVPYFRYFGPTAIVPGFKQMVVKVQDRRRNSMSATSSSCSGPPYPGFPSSLGGPDIFDLDDMPVYDPTDPAPVHELILNLVHTFFNHLGCNYPFLDRHRFPQMVKEKRVEAILVDAVCALAARFSDLPLFTHPDHGRLSRAEYGRAYAQRAKSATVDTFPCPSVGAVQACLLMAYEGFGANQDSALWMYLGLAIRMAADLGLQKLDGVRYQGERDPFYVAAYRRTGSREPKKSVEHSPERDPLSPREQRQVEQERTDTLWSVFFLDRVISSGTGRPVTLRDEDLELDLPKALIDPGTRWPDLMPPLIQIIHLYGRVSDILNNIRKSQDLTQDKLDRLLEMENELTRLYQIQDPRLRFDAPNFQHYVKHHQGTIAVLFHLWFHALIIVLHQPTLLTPLASINQMHQLLPHSRELSLSSAKTITDILTFAELVDPRSFIGNPFTSQPIYIAACAFLMEPAANASQPVSGAAPDARASARRWHRAGSDGKSSKHVLLASAANQNYQACYRALQQMESYWGGVRYILTALDQKSEGIWDCETYTVEEYESTRRPQESAAAMNRLANRMEHSASPNAAPPPLAWSYAGTTNSPNSQFTLLFQLSEADPAVAQAQHQAQVQAPPPPPGPPSSPRPPAQPMALSDTPMPTPTPPGSLVYDPIRQSLPEATSIVSPAYPQPQTSALRHSPGRNDVGPPSSVATKRNKPGLRLSNLPGGSGANRPSIAANSKVHHGALSAQAANAPMSMNTYPASSYQSSGHEQYASGASSASSLTNAALPSQSGNGSHSGTAGPHGGLFPSDGGGGSTSTGFTPGGRGGFGGSGSGSGASELATFGPSVPNLSLVTFNNEADIGPHLSSFEPNDMMGWFGDYFPGDVLGLYDGSGGM